LLIQPQLTEGTCPGNTKLRGTERQIVNKGPSEDSKMADNVSFKVYLKDCTGAGDNDEVRRFMVDKGVSTSLVYIKEKLISVFPKLEDRVFSVTWTDEDGDCITIDTDEELILALTEMAGPVYKLTAIVKGVKEAEIPRDESSGAGFNTIHPGVTCDGCDKGIVGFRYKCVVCDDYDLCAGCEAAGKHPGHNMMRMSNPEVIWPQRLFKRLHKMQEKAEMRSRSRQDKKEENGAGARAGTATGASAGTEGKTGTGSGSGTGTSYTFGPHTFSQSFSFPRGRGMFRGCTRGGMPGMAGGRGGMGGKGGIGGMGGMGGCGGMPGMSGMPGMAAGMAGAMGGMPGMAGMPGMPGMPPQPPHPPHNFSWAFPGGAAAWGGPTVEAMMKGWMGQSQQQTPTGDSSQAHQEAHENAQASAEAAHESAHAAAQSAAEAAHQTAHAAAAAAAQATKAAEEALAAAGIPASRNSDYLQQVGDFVAAALDPLGIDVQVDVETHTGERTTIKPSSSTETMEEEKEEVENEKMDVQEKSKKERSSSTSSSDDEEWTVLNDKKDETKTVEIPIQIDQKEAEAGGAPIYPSLPTTDNSVPTEVPDTTPMEEEASKVEEPKPEILQAVHPDPRIQVALQAMMNMGFSNDGGWLANLLEAKDGDIGKVLDILQPVKK